MSMVVVAPADWLGGESEAPATVVLMAKHGISPAGLHGGDAAAVAESLGLDPASMLDLSQNLNPFAPDVEQLVRSTQWPFVVIRRLMQLNDCWLRRWTWMSIGSA